MSEESEPLILSGGGDIFEITDFTVVTDTELFTVTIEHILHEWQLTTSSSAGIKRLKSNPLPADFIHRCSWSHDTKSITYSENRQFYISHVWPDGISENDINTVEEKYAAGISDLMLSESNFYPWSIITCQFGVFEYLLLSPVNEDIDGMNSEDDLQMIQSNVEIALSNCECSLPIFIQYGTPDRIFYVGSLQDGNIRTTFETIHTHKGFMKHKCFDGLLDLMKERLNDATFTGLDITVAVQLEYIIRNDFDYDDEYNDKSAYLKNFDIDTLPYGINKDVIKEFRLVTAWPELKQEAITDTVNYSDLDPYAAPRWKANVVFHKGVKCFLYQSLNQCKDFLKFTDDTNIKEILGDITDQKNAKAAFGSLISGGSELQLNFVNQNLPLEKNIIDEYITNIFTQNDDLLSLKRSTIKSEYLEKCLDNLKQAKTIPQDNFLEKLVTIILNCILRMNDEKDRILSISQIWNRFVLELRKYWENNEDIPGLDNDIPDLSKCLLYQKIQMVQCCIQSRRKRNELFDLTKNLTRDDEFYDAYDEFVDSEEKPLIYNDDNYEPEGRLCPAENLMLLNYPDREIYIPITQDRSPMTEDMLDEHAEYLASMSREDRVKAQLDVLISDMQAFKGANPGCCLEDFVRWHSPRDFIEDENNKGCLSERMNMEDNVWRKSWNNARPASVAHQTRLFNESKEAEQVLHMLDFIRISELFKLIMPIALTICIKKLITESTKCYSIVQDDLKNVIHYIIKYTQRQEHDDCLNAINLLGKIELTITQFQTLRKKFEDNDEKELNNDDDEIIDNDSNFDFDAFTMDLMSRNIPQQAYSNALPEYTSAPVTIVGAPNGPIAMAIRKIFHKHTYIKLSEAEHEEGISDSYELKFPPISRKYYVIRCLAPREKGSPRYLPQRLSAVIDDDEFRVCQSLTTDLSYY